MRQSSRRSIDVVLRTDGEPAALTRIATRAVHSLDADLPVHDPRPWSSYVSRALAQPRFTLILGSIFGGVALFLAAIALYGLVSYVVGQRGQELSLRMALGAEASAIVRLVVRQGLGLTLLGVGIGLSAAWFATRFLGSLLVGVRATDPLTFFGVALLLAAVALLACYLPARRATRIDPVLALRAQ
jgi:putative ABC transport system permease protein